MCWNLIIYIIFDNMLFDLIWSVSSVPQCFQIRGMKLQYWFKFQRNDCSIWEICTNRTDWLAYSAQGQQNLNTFFKFYLLLKRMGTSFSCCIFTILRVRMSIILIYDPEKINKSPFLSIPQYETRETLIFFSCRRQHSFEVIGCSYLLLWDLFSFSGWNLIEKMISFRFGSDIITLLRFFDFTFPTLSECFSLSFLIQLLHQIRYNFSWINKHIFETSFTKNWGLTRVWDLVERTVVVGILLYLVFLACPQVPPTGQKKETETFLLLNSEWHHFII